MGRHALDSILPEVMRILVTNDDGVGSPLLAALATALDALGDVDVIAPASDMTGVSRSLSLAGPIAVDEMRMPDGRAAFAVSGTPADCVRFGDLGLAGGKPDVVISGPNLGINLGDDVAYSGTVAAALEAALLGLPAAALSQQASPGRHATTPRSSAASPCSSCRCSHPARCRRAS